MNMAKIEWSGMTRIYKSDYHCLKAETVKELDKT